MANCDRQFTTVAARDCSGIGGAPAGTRPLPMKAPARADGGGHDRAAPELRNPDVPE